MAKKANEQTEVLEASGLYGFFKVEENLIQQIWKNGDFDQRNLHTSEGKSLKIINPGKWNLAEEGPDFKEATLSFNDKIVSGDIEIHIHEQDWQKHGHENNIAFGRVILHVVLYPTFPKKISEKNNIPCFTLLPKLLRSVEEYAEEMAMEKLSGNLALSSVPQNFPINWNQARDWAKIRWEAKCRHAKIRLENSSWESACHQWFLEVLGYPRNRIPMSRIAQLFPIQAWEKDLNPDLVYHSQNDWKLRGSRPANHPRKRIQQYANLIKNRRDWAKSMQRMEFPVKSITKHSPFSDRKELRLNKLENEFVDEILGGNFGGTKVHTTMIDACLPLWAAHHGKDAFESWFQWSAGDLPPTFRKWAQAKGMTNAVTRLSMDSLRRLFMDASSPNF